MKRPNRLRLRRWFWSGSLLLGLGAGCLPTCSDVDDGAAIPAGALPAPNGSYVRQFQDLQAARAEADDFVVYLHEWYLGGQTLGPYGNYHLDQIAKRLPSVPFPVVLQPGPDTKVNDARRELLVTRLVACGIADADVRVLIGYPEAEGLFGEEAECIFPEMIHRREDIHNGHGAAGHSFSHGFGGAAGSSRGY